MAALFKIIFLLHLFSQIQCEKVPFEERYVDQYLDHFNFDSAKAFGEVTGFTERYLIQDKWWKAGEGPIFFYTGNEGNIEEFWANSGFIMEIAPKFNALVVFAEHRFYGGSAPFSEWGPEWSFKHPYIGLLTIEQAMADYAHLISNIKETMNATKCPVITFGGSYGGMLSAYMRFKYPNLVDGAIAASAPIYLVAGKTDPYAFFKTVTDDIYAANQESVTSARKAFTDMAKLAESGKKGLAAITKIFQLCSPLQPGDLNHLSLYVRNAFTSLAMMDYPYPTDFLAPLPAYPIKAAAEMLVNGSTPLDGLAAATALFYQYSDKEKKCYNISELFIECADPTGCDLGLNSLAWDFQACTEVQIVQSTNFKTDMFPPLNYTYKSRADYCYDKWTVRPRDDWLALNLWGRNINHTSNIVFSNGDLDPWHLGGVLESISDSVVAVVIEGGAHHLDLRASNPQDPPSVIKARQIEVANIEKWITQARRNNSK
ncbi:unnamed protein product [Owenia fusiformis]|uniref:Dipeptidyl peptidase 2 n=1 Tax=Owenia fusiformis TaxID=6347 RepID=A0A8S4NZ10_OWEFU|nr:unnamed protein product [Owenia fusiformis]